MNSRFRTLAGLLVLPILAVACENATDPGADGRLRIVLEPAAGESISQSAARLILAEEAGVNNVSAVDVTVGGIDLLPVGEEDGGTGQGWVHLDGDEVDVNLMSLGTGIEVANVQDVPTGEYAALRLRIVGTPTIEFSQAILIGQQEYAAGEAYDLFIPSADQTGIKLFSGFAVAASGTTVTVSFDETASVRTISATGSGTVVMNPVLSVDASDE